jgi:flagellar hook-basal body complex protein FliE
MKIGDLNSLLPKINPQKTNNSISVNGKFDDVFGNFIKGVNKDQIDDQQITSDFIEGKDVEIHEVMIASEKAKTSLDLLMQIRNKTIDMYKELTRMQ